MYILILTTFAYIVWRASRTKPKNDDTELTKIIMAATILLNEAKKVGFHLLRSYLEIIQLGLSKISGNQTGNHHHFYKNEMSVEEARQILGVSPKASRDQILTAFKRLMLINHPDKGGTAYLADRIIKAKNVLVPSTKN